jgi:hypothetical protein
VAPVIRIKIMALVEAVFTSTYFMFCQLNARLRAINTKEKNAATPEASLTVKNPLNMPTITIRNKITMGHKGSRELKRSDQEHL